MGEQIMTIDEMITTLESVSERILGHHDEETANQLWEIRNYLDASKPKIIPPKFQCGDKVKVRGSEYKENIVIKTIERVVPEERRNYVQMKMGPKEYIAWYEEKDLTLLEGFRIP